MQKYLLPAEHLLSSVFIALFVEAILTADCITMVKAMYQ